MISNEEICSRLNFGCRLPFNVKGRYYFLYKTTCLCTGKIYIGVRSTNDYIKDEYIGCGIEPKVLKDLRKLQSKNSFFINAVIKYGFKNFVKEPLLFFSSREEALRAERIVVDQEFLDRQDTLNSNLGGTAPPRRIGVSNGNYKNYWSDEQKKKLSDYFKKTRNTKGENNSRARCVVVIDIFSKPYKTYELGCMIDCDKFLNLARCTTSKFLNLHEGHLYKMRYLVTWKSDLEKKWTVEEFVELNLSKISWPRYRIYYEIIHNFNFRLSNLDFLYLMRKYKKSNIRLIKQIYYACCRKYKKGN